MRRCLLWGLMFGSSWVGAESLNCFDMHGVSDHEKAILWSRYHDEIRDLHRMFGQLVQQDLKTLFSSEEAKTYIEMKHTLEDRIQKAYRYAYVAFETTHYGPHEDCTTLNIVHQNDHAGLVYLTKPSTPQHAWVKQNDVVDRMIDYQNKGSALFFKGAIDPKIQNCPVYHCTFGFHHPELKPYFAMFEDAALAQRALILRTLLDREHPERRAAAVFLVGHFKDPKDIVQTLMPHLNDTDESVRNNVIRVLATTTHQSHILDLNPAPFLALLDSPFSGERNKSLLLLLALAESEKTQQYLVKHGHQSLMSIFKMKQPNHQPIAYAILKRISGHDFGPYDAQAWDHWFKIQKNKGG